MPRRPDQNKRALKKDVARLTLIEERARRNKKRDPDLNREILSKTSWLKMKLSEEAID